MISLFMKKIMTKKYGKVTASELIKKAKPQYKKMILEAEDIGDKNPMASNIYMSFVFMAIWKVADGAITPMDMHEMTKELMGMSIVKKVYSSGNLNKPENMEKLRNQLTKSKDWADSHPKYRNKTWDFNFDKNLKGGEISYYFTRCPLNDYARAHGYMEILPIMCEIDFLTAKLIHAKLYRHETLAGGGDKCDYKYVGDGDEK